jgi:hypothetical protein
MPHKQGHAKNTRIAQGSINDESMGGLDQMGHIPMIRKSRMSSPRFSIAVH